MKLGRKQEGSFTGVKKILIFKLCCLGDSVFITPAVKSLRMNFPDSKIVYAHAKWIELIIPYVPCIDGSILFENVYSESIFKRAAGALKFILKVRKEKFDLVLFGHRSNLLSFILKLCGIRYRLGFSGTKHLTHTAKFEKDLPEFRRYLNILSESGLAVDESPPKLKSLPVDRFKEINGFKSGHKLIGIFPKGGFNPGTFMDIKQWGDSNYFKLVELINKGYPELNIIVFEGKYDIEKLSLPGELRTTKRTIANELIACCDYFISGDTGSLHIAAALGIPTLSIFGPSDPGVLSPVNIQGEPCKHIVIWKKPACSPCYTPDTSIDKSNKKYWHGNNFICNTGTHECLKLVTPEEVFDEFKKLLKHK